MNASYVAIDSFSGVHLRPATEDEVAAYWRENALRGRRSPFDETVRVGSISVEREGLSTGAGWHGGAGS